MCYYNECFLCILIWCGCKVIKCFVEYIWVVVYIYVWVVIVLMINGVVILGWVIYVM